MILRIIFAFVVSISSIFAQNSIGDIIMSINQLKKVHSDTSKIERKYFENFDFSNLTFNQTSKKSSNTVYLNRNNEILFLNKSTDNGELFFSFYKDNNYIYILIKQSKLYKKEKCLSYFDYNSGFILIDLKHGKIGYLGFEQFSDLNFRSQQLKTFQILDKDLNTIYYCKLQDDKIIVVDPKKMKGSTINSFNINIENISIDYLFKVSLKTTLSKKVIKKNNICHDYYQLFELGDRDLFNVAK